MSGFFDGTDLRKRVENHPPANGKIKTLLKKWKEFTGNMARHNSQTVNDSSDCTTSTCSCKVVASDKPT
jgi:hypothetical protein